MTMAGTESAVLRKLARISGKAGQGEALRRALIALEGETRKEAGCLEFSFFQALTAPDEFILIEAFKDAQALAAHMHEVHTRSFFELGLATDIKVIDLPVP